MKTAKPKYLTKDEVEISFSGAYMEDGWSNYYSVIDPDLKAGKGWNSGGHPIQWIQFNLKRHTTIESLELTVEILPPCEVSIVIEANVDAVDSEHFLLSKIREFHKGGMKIRVPVNATVKNIRITTLESKSWVAWKRVLLTRRMSNEDQQKLLKESGQPCCSII